MWIVCRATKNRPPKKDATNVFIPESDLVCQALEDAGKKFWTVDIDNRDNRLPDGRRADVLYSELGQVDWLEGLVYVGHGLGSSLPSLGIGPLRLPKLANKLAKAAGSTPLVVCLLACSAADGPRKGVATDGPGMDRGFADTLRDLLCVRGLADCRVWAHTTSGHATMNPDLAVFEGLGSPVGGVGGRLLIPQGSPLRSRFRKAMRVSSKQGPSLRHRIALMSPEAVVREVVAGI